MPDILSEEEIDALLASAESMKMKLEQLDQKEIIHRSEDYFFLSIPDWYNKWDTKELIEFLFNTVVGPVTTEQLNRFDNLILRSWFQNKDRKTVDELKDEDDKKLGFYGHYDEEYI